MAWKQATAQSTSHSPDAGTRARVGVLSFMILVFSQHYVNPTQVVVLVPNPCLYILCLTVSNQSDCRRHWIRVTLG